MGSGPGGLAMAASMGVELINTEAVEQVVSKLMPVGIF